MVIWIEEDIFKILDTHITLEEKILCILYYKNNICETELFKLTEYSNITIFKKKLKKMHTEQKINYTKDKITISPIGINLAEDKLNKKGNKYFLPILFSSLILKLIIKKYHNIYISNLETMKRKTNNHYLFWK